MLKTNSFLDESINSQKANLSHLDEALKIDKNLINSKKITINRYLLNKLLNFFHNLIQTLDTTIENKKTMFQLIDLVSTEENNFSLDNNFENEKIVELKTDLENLKTENENFKKNQHLLNSFNAELTEEVSLLCLN